MPECPACGGQRNSYHPLCYNCEPVLDDYYISSEGFTNKFPPSVKRYTVEFDIGYTEEDPMPQLDCPAAELVHSAANDDWLVNCRIARRIQDDAKLFPAEGCKNYTRCRLWIHDKTKETV